MKKAKAVILGGLVIVGIGLMVWYVTSRPKIESTTFVDLMHAPTYYSTLDGAAVSSTTEVTPRVVGVMIDNHPDARPQSGLSKARVVYEAMAEGGITRYLAIFNASSTVGKVGPVRSARPYFIDWLREYGDNPYIHCGGSPAALAFLATGAVFDVNQFWYDQYFWRSHDRLAPHNLYTSSDLWNKLFAEHGAKHNGVQWEGWKFLQPGESVEASSTASQIKIIYGPDYYVTWKYDATIKKYIRSVNGYGDYKDQEGNVITADSVVVQETTMQVLDEKGRKEIGTVGSGRVSVYMQGKEIPGTWKKGSVTERTHWYDESGNEIALTPGQEWVEVVPVGTSVEVKD